MANTTTTNLSIYDKVRSVPQEAQKSFSNGSFSGTDINPMWRIRILTETFGPCGLGWYCEPVEHWEEVIDGEVITNVAINLYVKYNGEWSKPIYGIGGNRALQVFPGKNGAPAKAKISDEAYKMALTDAMSVACKSLGIGADIYWQNDPTKYSPREVAPSKDSAPVQVAPAPQQTAAPVNATSTPSIDELIAMVSVCSSNSDIKGIYEKYRYNLSDADRAALFNACTTHPLAVAEIKKNAGRTVKNA